MTEWYINDVGKRMKRTTKYKLVETNTMISRGIVARRNRKFASNPRAACDS